MDKSYLQGDEWCKDEAHVTGILVIAPEFNCTCKRK